MKQPAVYMLASQRNGTLYIGVTSNLIQRIWQHREGVVEGFSQQHAVKTLVWYELHETMESAISREKALKKWNRAWKLRVIEERNPRWLDLWPEIIGEAELRRPLPPQLRHSQPYPEEKGAPQIRHSRAGGNLASTAAAAELDSRLRGNDGAACAAHEGGQP